MERTKKTMVFWSTVADELGGHEERLVALHLGEVALEPGDGEAEAEVSVDPLHGGGRCLRGHHELDQSFDRCRVGDPVSPHSLHQRRLRQGGRHHEAEVSVAPLHGEDRCLRGRGRPTAPVGGRVGVQVEGRHCTNVAGTPISPIKHQ